MNPTALVRVFIGLTMLLVVPLLQAAESSCLLRVRADIETSTLSLDAIGALVNSRTGGRGAALDDPRVRAVLEGRTLPLEDVLRIALEAAGPQVRRDDAAVTLVRLVIEVHEELFPDGQAVADDVLIATCRRLRASLQRLGEEDRQQLAQRRAAAADAIAASLDEQRRLNQEYQALCDQAGMLELSSGDIRARIGELTGRRQDLELNLAGREAERAALTAQVAQLRERLKQEGENDPVARELRRIVELREKQLESVERLVKNGRAPESDLLSMQEAVAQARAGLMERQQAVIQQSGGELLRKFNEMLTMQAVQIEESRAELQAIQAELESIRQRNLLGLARRYENDLRIRMRLVERQLQKFVEHEQEVKQLLATYQPPTLTVLGGLPEQGESPESGTAAE